MTNIDFTKSEQYTLSIRLSADGFSFSVHSIPSVDECYYASIPTNASYSLTANIKTMMATTDALRYPYKQINILVDTQRFTTIPFELFEDEQTEEFFYHNFPKNNHETVLCNILGKSNIALLFGMDKYAHQLLNEHFPNARIFACISPLAEYFAQKSREENGGNMYVHFKKNVMEVFAFDKGKLLLMNSFACQQPTDQVYYLLYTWQQLGFNQEKDQIWLAGHIGQEELLPELNKFIRHTHVLPSHSTITFDIETLIICE